MSQRPSTRRAADAEDDAAARFKHLIEPIRDLAKNWNVDVASELEDYIGELESISFSADGGVTQLNFAEAALLIQGSACIYSKKVEYLYELVFQAINFIEKRKRKEREAAKLGSSVSADGADKDVDPLDEDELDFLMLDDDIPEAEERAINMREKDLEMETCPPPTAYRPKFPWLLRQATDRGDGEYNLSQMHVHRSGALLLDQGDIKALDDNLEPVAQPNFEDINAAGDFGAGGYDDDDDFGDGGSGDFGEGGAPGEAPASGYWVAQERAAGGNVPPTPALTLHGEDEEEYNPYEPLDADDAKGVGKLTVRPFRKGRTQLSKSAIEGEPVSASPAEGVSRSGVDHGVRVSAAPTAPTVLSQPAFKEFSFAFEAARRAARALRRANARRLSGLSPGPGQRAAELTPGSRAAAFDAPAAQDDPGYEDDMPDFGGGGDDFDDDVDGDMGAFPDVGEQGAAGTFGWLSGGGNNAAALSTPRSVSAAVSYAELVRAKVDELLARTLASERVTELSRRVTNWRDQIEPALEEEEKAAAFDIHQYGDGVLSAVAMDAKTGKRKADDVVRGTKIDFADVFAAARRAKVDEATSRGEDPSTAGAGTEAGEIARTFAATLQLINDGALEIEAIVDDSESEVGEGGAGAADAGVAKSFKITVLNPHRQEITTAYDQIDGGENVAAQAEAKKRKGSKRATADTALRETQA